MTRCIVHLVALGLFSLFLDGCTNQGEVEKAPADPYERSSSQMLIQETGRRLPFFAGESARFSQGSQICGKLLLTKTGEKVCSSDWDHVTEFGMYWASDWARRVEGVAHPHKGLPTVATFDGFVYKVKADLPDIRRDSSSWGNTVVFCRNVDRTCDDNASCDCDRVSHCREVMVREGQFVFQGQILCSQGTSGWSDNDHIHNQHQKRIPVGPSVREDYIDLGIALNKMVVGDIHTSHNSGPIRLKYEEYGAENFGAIAGTNITPTADALWGYIHWYCQGGDCSHPASSSNQFTACADQDGDTDFVCDNEVAYGHNVYAAIFDGGEYWCSSIIYDALHGAIDAVATHWGFECDEGAGWRNSRGPASDAGIPLNDEYRLNDLHCDEQDHPACINRQDHWRQYHLWDGQRVTWQEYPHRYGPGAFSTNEADPDHREARAKWDNTVSYRFVDAYNCHGRDDYDLCIGHRGPVIEQHENRGRTNHQASAARVLGDPSPQGDHHANVYKIDNNHRYLVQYFNGGEMGSSMIMYDPENYGHRFVSDTVTYGGRNQACVIRTGFKESYESHNGLNSLGVCLDDEYEDPALHLARQDFEFGKCIVWRWNEPEDGEPLSGETLCGRIDGYNCVDFEDHRNLDCPSPSPNERVADNFDDEGFGDDLAISEGGDEGGDGIGGGECPDDDADGFRDVACGGTDCDDTNPNVYPWGPESCNNVDDDCNGVVDNGFNLASNRHNCGSCGNECDEDQSCSAGVCTDVCVPTGDELCNEWDDDCNGETDEGFDFTVDHENCGACQNDCLWHEECFQGSCREVSHPESCDNLDNDYDGVVDNYTIACETICGEGTRLCNHGNWEDCSAPLPSTEVCNGQNDDCDNATDENLGSTTCGVGACSRTVANCVDGVPQTCLPGNPAAESCGNNADDDCDGQVDEDCVQIQVCNPSPEACNGLDDDCDNLADEGLGSTTCGVGICRRTVSNCVGGFPQTCTPGPSQAESCNNADDDCDGFTDETLTRACSTACEDGIQTCGNGLWGTCSARQPSPEVCDGLDNNCDGATDEGVKNACGQCGPVPVEVCDGQDNDCDQQIDEGLVCGDDGLHEVRVLYCPGEDGTLNTDMPENAGWNPHQIVDGCIDITFQDVPGYLARLQGVFLNGTAWECNEWPLGTFWLRHDIIPRAWIDGFEVEVTYGHEERLVVGCNFFLDVL